MSSTLDKMNLRPGEKRLLVGIGIVLFVVVNFMVVTPKFGEFGRIRSETETLQTEINKFQAMIDKRPKFERELKELEGQGSKIIKEEQSLRLLQTVQSQALASGFTINSSRETTSSSFSTSTTNSFFDERSLIVQYDTGYRQLISFLVGLAEQESMIRVRSMDVKPDPSHQRIQGNITLVASYQRSRNSSAAPGSPSKSTDSKK